MNTTLLVLAAGMGSRYGGLKQLDQVGINGETIIDYSVYDAMRSGFNKVVFVIRKDIEEEFKEKISLRYSDKITVEHVFQDKNDLPGNFSCPENREKPWGTGQAVLVAKNVIKEPFAAINADDFYGYNGFKLLHSYLQKVTDLAKLNCVMCGFELEKTLSDFGTVCRGVCKVDENKKLIKIEELTKIEKKSNEIINTLEDGTIQNFTGKEIVSLNMWGFTPRLFDCLEQQFTEFLHENINESKSEFFLPFAIDHLIKENTTSVDVLTSPDSWIGITYKEDKPSVIERIKKLIAQGIYPEKLF